MPQRTIQRRPGPQAILKIAVLIEEDGKLLLIRERVPNGSAYGWNTVKGTFEADRDRDFVSAAKREAWEEARAKVAIDELLHVLYTYRRGGTYAFVQFNFIGKLKGQFGVPPKKMQRKHGEDIVDVRLFARAELKKMERKDFLNERAYFAVREWLAGGPRYHVSSLKKLARL